MAGRQRPAYNQAMLTPRQEQILSTVVEAYLHTGQPVSSRAVATDPGLDCGPSTVRGELALLEAYGLLDHPHVSAGRVPTDAGHRYLVDRLLSSERSLPVPARRFELTRIKQEIDDAMRAASETLSQMTNLLAVVSAPSINTATIRHIEVLELQPQVVLIVIITSAGNVAKMLAKFDRDVDPGLVSWAGEYLNERLIGLPVGSRMLTARMADPSLSSTELDFLTRFGPAFSQLASEGEDVLYLDGTARLFEAGQMDDHGRVNELIGLLEQRVALLSVMRAALTEPGVYVRIGSENELPAMHSLALVASGYGVAQRKLGTVSVIGPVRMDYAGTIATVREAAHELSRFVEDAYAEN
jgi:heat-inducible transcriptional repressor